MSNLSEKIDEANVQSHIINKAFEIIDPWTPKKYDQLVIDRLPPGVKYSKSLIRDIRNRAKGRIIENYPLVVNLLVEVAKENQSKFQKLEESLQ